MFGSDVYLILILFLAGISIMLLVVWTDLKSFRIPNIPTIAIAALGLASRYLQNEDLRIVVLVAVIVGLLIFIVAKILEIIRMKPVLGYGDIKLFIAAAIWLKVVQLPAFFVMTGLFGLLIALLYWKKKYFPLAPAIATAWALTLVM